MNLLADPGTFDIYRATNNRTGFVHYTCSPAGHLTSLPNYTLKQMTVGTPLNVIGEVIYLLEKVRGNHE